MNGSSGVDVNQQATPIEDLRINLDGVSWRYQRAGSGPVLLLVHGLFGYSFSWRFAIPQLARAFTVYAVDMPGAGFSDFPSGTDCSLRPTSERLLRFMDEQGISSCDLLGTSHGGAVAMMTAAVAPGRFRRLILVDPVNPWSGRGKLLSVVFSNPVVAPFFLRFGPRLRLVQRHYLRRLYGDIQRMRPGTMEGYRAPLLRRESFAHAIGVLRSWNHDLRELESVLPKIQHIPTLLIWGDRDTAVYPISAPKLKAQFRQVRLLMLAGVGHLPYEEAPEEFNRAVLEFVSERQSPGE